MPEYYFSIAVCAANEAALIGPCIESIDRACAGYPTHISILLNGSRDDSEVVLRGLRLTNAHATAYVIDVADKANALNEFLLHLRPAATFYGFIDGYVVIGDRSLHAIDEAFAANPQALIASAVPVTGRSASAVYASTMRGGTTNGQFFAARSSFAERFAAAGLRLPVQLYRVDGLLGSMGAHDFDAQSKPWDNARIIGVAGATFAIRPLSVFRLADIRRQYAREIRQARGRMENAAIKSIIQSGGYAALPANATEMVVDWLKTNTPEARSWREAYFQRLALKALGQPRLGATRPRTSFEIARQGAGV